MRKARGAAAASDSDEEVCTCVCVCVRARVRASCLCFSISFSFSLCLYIFSPSSSQNTRYIHKARQLTSAAFFHLWFFIFFHFLLLFVGTWCHSSHRISRRRSAVIICRQIYFTYYLQWLNKSFIYSLFIVFIWCRQMPQQQRRGQGAWGWAPFFYLFIFIYY